MKKNNLRNFFKIKLDFFDFENEDGKKESFEVVAEFSIGEDNRGRRNR